jgi:hypothetical protein
MRGGIFGFGGFGKQHRLVHHRPITERGGTKSRRFETGPSTTGVGIFQIF